MSQVNVGEMLLRVALAFFAGFAVGWERESHGRPAGLRTNILACVASAVAMIVSENLLLHSVHAGLSDALRADPARLAAGILTGIGFLGAGTILRQDDFVRGVTTAATLWVVTILGLAFGSGQFVPGLLGLAFTLVTLVLLPPLEKHIRGDWYATVVVTSELAGIGEQEVKQRIEQLGLTVLAMQLSRDLTADRKTTSCELKLERRQRHELCTKVVTELSSLPGVSRVDWT
jgi:putative Mg2+ transporter-C (MgtC) family protein